MTAETIDFFRNSTSAGNLYVDSVLKSSRTLKYAAVLRSESPSNSLPEASFERSLITKLHSFIAKIVSLLEVELDELGGIKCNNTVTVKKNITETLNKLVYLIIQLNKLSKDGYLNNDDTNMEEADALIITEYLSKYQ